MCSNHAPPPSPGPRRPAGHGLCSARPIVPLQQPAYRLPSPPTATYQAVDATTIDVGTPMGRMEGSGNSSFTFAVSFTADGDGVRAVGELTEFAARGNDPMRGPAAIGRSDAGVGNFDLLLDCRGWGRW